MKPSALRAIPAETTAAKAKDPNWKLRGRPGDIPISRARGIGGNIKQYIGDARGHWQGDTLVVETTNFTNKTAVSGAPHTDSMKLTECFTRIDPQMIDYRFRVEDPEMFAAPFTMRLTITEQPGLPGVRVLLPRGKHGGRSGAQRRTGVREGRGWKCIQARPSRDVGLSGRLDSK